MRASKIILSGVVVTIMAGLYVHQQIEIFKAGYCLQSKKERLSCLTDRNTKLMYDLSRLESPRYLLTFLESENVEFACSRSGKEYAYKLASLDNDKQGLTEGFLGKVFNLFTPSAEARPGE